MSIWTIYFVLGVSGYVMALTTLQDIKQKQYGVQRHRFEPHSANYHTEELLFEP